MNEAGKLELVKIVGDSKAELPLRLRSLQDLVSVFGTSVALDLKNLLGRPRPKQGPIKKWDPEGAERVVDLHIVAALHRLGDDSELNRIATLVRHAGKILVGSDDELYNAAIVILAIGRTEPVGQLIGLTSDSDAQVVRNAVRTLDQLKLPEPPVRQAASMPRLAESVTFTINRLREELQTIASLSNGVVVLSPGVQDYLLKHDYGRGQVRREDVTLRDIIEKDLPELEFDYYVEGQQVVVCTYGEAGGKWRNWWQKYSAELEYLPLTSTFVLRPRA